MPIKWKKVWISDENYESAGVFDVNNDGIPDIVSGAFWYEGPDYRKKHFIGAVRPEGEYYDDFSTIALDVNNDGYLDIITGGWWGNNLRWRENPGADASKPWVDHIIDEATGNVETTRAWDIDNDGVLEIFPNTPPSKEVFYYKLENGVFRKIIIHTFAEGSQGHGIGCGDLAGNGRLDIILAHGWLEAPPNPETGKWIYHPDFKDPPWGWAASDPMLVVDVDGDGQNELIVGAGHNYGLWWCKRAPDGVWTYHPIDPYCSQYHDLHWIDIDNDGKPELVTGKRHRAHCGNDPGEWDDVGIYYFKWTGEGFAKQVIDYGAIGDCHGCGIHFALSDLRNTGRLDFIAPSKGGLFVYFNEGM